MVQFYQNFRFFQSLRNTFSIYTYIFEYLHLAQKKEEEVEIKVDLEFYLLIVEVIQVIL